jgi:hypothetical protein
MDTAGKVKAIEATRLTTTHPARWEREPGERSVSGAGCEVERHTSLDEGGMNRLSSAVAQAFELFGVPRALNRDRRGRPFDIGKVVMSQVDIGRADVFLETMPFGRTRDRHDPRLPGQQPRESHLPSRHLLAFGNGPQQRHQRLIGLPVLCAEARHRVAEVSGIERGRLVDPAGQEAFAFASTRRRLREPSTTCLM